MRAYRTNSQWSFILNFSHETISNWLIERVAQHIDETKSLIQSWDGAQKDYNAQVNYNLMCLERAAHALRGDT